MKVFNTVSQLQEVLQQERNNGKTIGFVPTMGALHEGHLSLVKQCLAHYDICVVSIFVNPTQFNDAKDLETYPRTPNEDLEALQRSGCEYVFMPSIEEIYPQPDQRVFDFGVIGEIMEGAHRPGHFNGVAQVVSRLFAIVAPEGAFFGEKDFQQIAIVRSMVKQLQLAIQIHSCPIIREESGLALSSRNKHLSADSQPYAPIIYKTLIESKQMIREHTPEEVRLFVLNTLANTPHLQPEYYEIVDAETLTPISSWSSSSDPVGCITCYCGEVRLIDNIHYLA